MKLLWLTDTHFDFYDFFQFEEVIDYYKTFDFDAVVITGDIANNNLLELSLASLRESVGVPVYFVLGNHDYYYGSYTSTQQKVVDLCYKTEKLFWLNREVILLTEKTALTGAGGWYDARTGKPEGPGALEMADWELIEDFKGLESSISIRLGTRTKIIEKAKYLCEKELMQARINLEKVLRMESVENVIFATHYPPYLAACVHEGEISEPIWAAWFTSVAMGKLLDKLVKGSGKKVTVLCGHTHSKGTYKRFNNLEVITGAAIYGTPTTAGVLEVL